MWLLASNLSSAGQNLCDRALGLRVKGSQPLKLGGGGQGQGQEAKQNNNHQLLHLGGYPVANIMFFSISWFGIKWQNIGECRVFLRISFLYSYLQATGIVS
jgi:hypothetical protein